jgi:hypothetical protein
MTVLVASRIITRRRCSSSVVLRNRKLRARLACCGPDYFGEEISIQLRFYSADNETDNRQQVRQVDPPSKNIGNVVGAWVFCRHGDRTPGRPLCPPHRQTDEAHFWLTKLPYPSTAHAYKQFCGSFPPLIDDPTGHFLDVHRNPYGFVTHKGLLQMQNNGRLMRQRYDPNWRSSSKGGSNSDEFLKKWRIAAFSTNYLRTVLSLQSFLDGLLDTNLYAPTSTRDGMDYTSMRPQEWPVPDHNFIQTPPGEHDDSEDEEGDFEEHVREGYGSDWEADPRVNPEHLYLPKKKKQNQSSKPKVFVRVRDQSCDNLNAFDRNPDLMRDLVSDVMQSNSFLHQDATAAPLAARLANILPGLARKGRSDFSASTPSGINWVEAADHFICRTAHQLELSRFSDFEHDEHIEQLLKAMTYKALGHLAWRFRKWYRNPQLLAAIAAPPLREVAQQLEHLVNRSTEIRALQDPHANFLSLYSCHDVTLLALLYALGADFLAEEESAVWREYWPEYASTLVLELVNLNPEERASLGTEAEHVIRVLINGRVVTSTDFLFQKFERDKSPPVPFPSLRCKTTLNTLGQGPYNLLTTQDFWNIITQLESFGEYDFSQWPTNREDSDSEGKPDDKKPKPSRTKGSLNSSLN